MRVSPAYLDPGAVTYIVSGIAAIVITAGAAVGVFRKKIRLALTKRKTERLERKLTRQADKKERTEVQAKDV